MEDAWASVLLLCCTACWNLSPDQEAFPPCYIQNLPRSRRQASSHTDFIHAIYRIFFSKIVYIFMDFRQARDLAKDIYDL